MTELRDVEKAVHNVTIKLEAKLNEVANVLNETKVFVEDYFYSHNRRNLQSTIFDCLNTKKVFNQYEILQGNGVLNDSYFEENFSVDLGKASFFLKK